MKKIFYKFFLLIILLNIILINNIYAASTGSGASISGGGSSVGGGGCNWQTQYCNLSNSTNHVNGVRLTLVDKKGNTVGNSVDVVVANTWTKPVNGKFYVSKGKSVQKNKITEGFFGTSLGFMNNGNMDYDTFKEKYQKTTGRKLISFSTLNNSKYNSIENYINTKEVLNYNWKSVATYFQQYSNVANYNKTRALIKDLWGKDLSTLGCNKYGELFILIEPMLTISKGANYNFGTVTQLNYAIKDKQITSISDGVKRSRNGAWKTYISASTNTFKSGNLNTKMSVFKSSKDNLSNTSRKGVGIVWIASQTEKCQSKNKTCKSYKNTKYSGYTYNSKAEGTSLGSNPSKKTILDTCFYHNCPTKPTYKVDNKKIYKLNSKKKTYKDDVMECYSTLSSCSDLSTYWKGQNAKKTYFSKDSGKYKLGDACFKVSNFVVKTSVNNSNCKKGYSYNDGLNFSYTNFKTNVETDYTYKASASSPLKHDWASVLKKCYKKESTTCDDSKYAEEASVKYAAKIYIRNDKYKSIPVNSDDLNNQKQIINKCYTESKNTCLDFAKYWKPLNLKKTYYTTSKKDNSIKCYDEYNNFNSLDSSCVFGYTYPYNSSSNKYDFIYTSPRNGKVDLYKFKANKKNTTLKDYEWGNFLDTCYEKKSLKCSDVEFVDDNASYKDEKGFVYKRLDDYKEIDINKKLIHDDYEKNVIENKSSLDEYFDYLGKKYCYNKGERGKKDCDSNEEDLKDFIGTFNEGKFDYDKYNAIKDDYTKENYLRQCKPDCNGPIEAFTKLHLTPSGGLWNKEISDKLKNDEEAYKNYQRSCNPCNFNANENNNCSSDKLNINCDKDSSNINLTANEKESNIVSSLSTLKYESKYILDEIFDFYEKSGAEPSKEVKDAYNELKSSLEEIEEKEDQIEDDSEDYTKTINDLNDKLNNLIEVYNDHNGNPSNPQIAVYRSDLDNDQIRACLASIYDENDEETFDNDDSNLNFKDLYGIKSICKDEYIITYSSTNFASGINTKLGFSKYLGFHKTSTGDNTIKAKAIRTCYTDNTIDDNVREYLNDLENDDYYPSAPDLDFTYYNDEKKEAIIPNEGFAIDSSLKEKPIIDNDNQTFLYTVTYNYKPKTRFLINTEDGKIYYDETDQDDIFLNDKNKFFEKVNDYDKTFPMGNNGHVFPILFNSNIQNKKENDTWDTYIENNKRNYKINVNSYNINEKAINYNDDDNSDCKSSYQCNYILSKIDCTNDISCTYVCDNKDDEKDQNLAKNNKNCHQYCVCKDDPNTSTKKQTLNFIYTNISTDKLLDDNTITKIGNNWNNSKGKATKKIIQEKSVDGETFDDEAKGNLVYEIKLDSKAINAIKEDIKQNNKYVGELTCNDDEEINSGYNSETGKILNDQSAKIRVCHSNWLSNLGKTPEGEANNYGLSSEDVENNVENSRVYFIQNINGIKKITAWK